METLVIKNNLLSGGTEKLYRDVIVSNGTLFCLDFSNSGCVPSGGLESVRDLALESKQDLGIPNDVSFLVTDRGEVPSLTSLGGYPLVDLGSYSANDVDSGLNIGGVDAYLNENQPERTLFTFWIGPEDNGGVDTLLAWMGGGDGSSMQNSNNIRLQGGTESISARLGGIGFASAPRSGINQFSIERVGLGEPNKLYINGIYYGEAGEGSTPFEEATRPLSIGVKTPGVSSNTVIYRAFLEDLTVSGRSALGVIQKDYNYVNALGEYTGIQKRPYANVA